MAILAFKRLSLRSAPTNTDRTSWLSDRPNAAGMQRGNINIITYDKTLKIITDIILIGDETSLCIRVLWHPPRRGGMYESRRKRQVLLKIARPAWPYCTIFVVNLRRNVQLREHPMRSLRISLSTVTRTCLGGCDVFEERRWRGAIRGALDVLATVAIVQSILIVTLKKFVFYGLTICNTCDYLAPPRIKCFVFEE